MHSIETGHSANIFCTKFIPETSDELVVSGAADAEVILPWQTIFIYDLALQLSGSYFV